MRGAVECSVDRAGGDGAVGLGGRPSGLITSVQLAPPPPPPLLPQTPPPPSPFTSSTNQPPLRSVWGRMGWQSHCSAGLEWVQRKYEVLLMRTAAPPVGFASVPAVKYWEHAGSLRIPQFPTLTLPWTPNRQDVRGLALRKNRPLLGDLWGGWGGMQFQTHPRTHIRKLALRGLLRLTTEAGHFRHKGRHEAMT